jgi:hypothetical protein
MAVDTTAAIAHRGTLPRAMRLRDLELQASIGLE